MKHWWHAPPICLPVPSDLTQHQGRKYEQKVFKPLAFAFIQHTLAENTFTTEDASVLEAREELVQSGAQLHGLQGLKGGEECGQLLIKIVSQNMPSG